MKTFTPTPELQGLLEQMSRDMAVPVEGLVNQAVFNWAKLHGYVAPGQVVAAEEPLTSRVPVVEAPEDPWQVVSGGSLLASQAVNALKLVLIIEGAEHEVTGERFLIGRDVSCDLTIDAVRVSRQHAAIHAGPQGFELEDLGSSNGTWFEGERITRKPLLHGDEVRFGDTVVRVEVR